MEDKKFTCSACEETWNIEFLAKEYSYFDNTEFNSSPAQICFNCYGPAVCVGMSVPEVENEPDQDQDLPF